MSSLPWVGPHHGGPLWLWTFQESEVEGGEYQDDSYIHRQPFPEPVFEEQEIYRDDNGRQQHCIEYGSRLVTHLCPLFKWKALQRESTASPRSSGVLRARHSDAHTRHEHRMASVNCSCAEQYGDAVGRAPDDADTIDSRCAPSGNRSPNSQQPSFRPCTIVPESEDV
jgi:hypothetical protein